MKRQIVRSLRTIERKLSSARSRASRFVRNKSFYSRQYTSPATIQHTPSDSDLSDNVFEATEPIDHSDSESSPDPIPLIPCEFCHLPRPANRLAHHQTRCRRQMRLNAPIQRASPHRRTVSEAERPSGPAPSAPPPSPLPARPAVAAAAAASMLVVDDYPPPDDLLCPITASLFEDPVSATDGHTYERRAITQCIRGNGRSPLTRERLTVDSLVPNRLIKKMVDTFLAECEQKRSLFKFRLDVDLKKSEQTSSLKVRHKAEYLIEWLRNREPLNNSNTILVHFNGENAEKVAELNCKLPKHPHLVATLGRVEHAGEGVFVVREHASVQTLTELIASSDHSLPNALLDLIFSQIASALECLAGVGVVHGNLTADNILIYHLDDVIENIVVKLTNISEYWIQRRSGDHEQTHPIAPEVLSNQIYSERSDVFAFGALAHSVYRCESDRQVLFDQCLATDVQARPTFHQILETMEQWTGEEKSSSYD